MLTAVKYYKMLYSTAYLNNAGEANYMYIDESMYNLHSGRVPTGDVGRVGDHLAGVVRGPAHLQHLERVAVDVHRVTRPARRCNQPMSCYSAIRPDKATSKYILGSHH